MKPVRRQRRERLLSSAIYVQPLPPLYPPAKGQASFCKSIYILVKRVEGDPCIRPHKGLTVVGSNEVQDGGLLEGTSVLAALTLATAGVHKKGSKESGLVWSKGTKRSG